MKFSVISAFPQMIQESLAWGVVGQALKKGLFEVQTINPRDYTQDVHKTIDDRPFGGGDGMVMLYEPLDKALQDHPELHSSRKIYLSPAGRTLDEALVKELSQEKHLTLLCGRYGGVDQRFLNQHHFENISVGDYVVSGGELPALMIIDAIARKIPGTLGHQDSAKEDSCASSPFFEAPLYTRPRENVAGSVPSVLLSGDHKKIEEFRKWVGQALTLQARPGLKDQVDLVGLKKYLQKMDRQEAAVVGISSAFLDSFLGGE